MRISRTFDYELVRALMTHPRVYPWLADDGSPPPEEYEPPESDLLYYLLVEEDGPVGVFLFVPENAATVHVHTCLTPAIWGRSIEATEAARRWIFENTQFQRITTTIPEDNRLAARLAVRSGMKEYGRNPKSYLKGGVLLDQVLYGMNKEQPCRQ